MEEVSSDAEGLRNSLDKEPVAFTFQKVPKTSKAVVALETALKVVKERSRSRINQTSDVITAGDASRRIETEVNKELVLTQRLLLLEDQLQSAVIRNQQLQVTNSQLQLELSALRREHQMLSAEQESKQRAMAAFKLAITEEIESAHETHLTQLEVKDAQIREMRLKFGEITELNDFMKDELDKAYEADQASKAENLLLADEAY